LIPGHRNDSGNGRADELGVQAGQLPPRRLANPVSIAWMRKTVSKQYTAAANIELREKGKPTITPAPSKKSALDTGPSWETRLESQVFVWL
jgi:hypothetical protein